MEFYIIIFLEVQACLQACLRNKGRQSKVFLYKGNFKAIQNNYTGHHQGNKICCFLEQTEFRFLTAFTSFYILIKPKGKSEIHFLKALENKAQRNPDLQKKGEFKVHEDSRLLSGQGIFHHMDQHAEIAKIPAQRKVEPRTLILIVKDRKTFQQMCD